MAGRIQGITVEIGGDTTKLQTALKGVNTEIRNTQGSLLSLQLVSEQLIFFHKRRDIHMNNSAAMLNQIVPSDYIFRIIIFDAF